MTFATFFVGFGLLFVATISIALFGSAFLYLLRSAWETTRYLVDRAGSGSVRAPAMPARGGEWQQAD